jgi:hypothetical protein
MKKYVWLVFTGLCIAGSLGFGAFTQQKEFHRPEPLKLPDLTVSNMRVVMIDGKCKVEITILNQGSGGVPEEKYGMVGDDSKASSSRVAISGIPSVGRFLRNIDPDRKLQVPGGSVTHVWFVTDDFSTLPAGVSSVTATLDDNSRIMESNETNNRLTKRLNCIALGPDLIVSRIYMKPEAPKAGQESFFFAEIKNIGNVAAPPTKASFKIGGETYPKIFAVLALAPSAVFTVRRSETLAIPRHYLATAIADSAHTLAETNETNNEITLPFEVK